MESNEYGAKMEPNKDGAKQRRSQTKTEPNKDGAPTLPKLKKGVGFAGLWPHLFMDIHSTLSKFVHFDL